MGKYYLMLRKLGSKLLPHANKLSAGYIVLLVLSISTGLYAIRILGAIALMILSIAITIIRIPYVVDNWNPNIRNNSMFYIGFYTFLGVAMISSSLAIVVGIMFPLAIYTFRDLIKRL